MLDFGLTELFLILAIAVLVIGPEQAPKIMYQIGRVIHRIRHMKFALNQQFEHFMDQQDRQNPHAQTRFERHGHQSPQQANQQHPHSHPQDQDQDQENIEMMDDLDESLHMPIPPSMQPDIIPDDQGNKPAKTHKTGDQ